jgi:hypothetical protein
MPPTAWWCSPIYLVLFSNYVTQMFSGLDELWLIGLKYAGLVVALGLNIRGLELVSLSSLVFTVVIIAPFIVQAFFVSPRPDVWDRGPRHGVHWSVFMSTLLWNFQGFDSMGSLAGEVKNARVTYPVGILVGSALITSMYILPVLGEALSHLRRVLLSCCCCRAVAVVASLSRRRCRIVVVAVPLSCYRCPCCVCRAVMVMVLSCCFPFIPISRHRLPSSLLA